MIPVVFLGLFSFGCDPFVFGQGPSAVVSIRSAPAHPIIEARNGTQSLNFDLIVHNESKLSLRLSQIELSVYDRNKRLVLRKSLNTDAFAPSIAVIGKQTLIPDETLDVFNPFFEFEAAVPLDQLQYSFCLLRESTPQERQKNLHRLPDDCDFRQELSISPRRYKEKTSLVLPLSGKIFVWEGHDFYAHHLRVPLGSSKVQALGITANSNEFANDFIYVDDAGHAYHDDPRTLENWYSYGKAVYAPGSGVIVASANDIPENWFEDAKATRVESPKLSPDKDPKELGNFVLINHLNGEYSLLLHLKPGSVLVKPGDHVMQGQQIGRIGFTGDAIFPHLHYSLMEGPDVFKAWGVPQYFSHFRRDLGTASDNAKSEAINSGDFVISTAAYLERK